MAAGGGGGGEGGSSHRKRKRPPFSKKKQQQQQHEAPTHHPKNPNPKPKRSKNPEPDSGDGTTLLSTCPAARQLGFLLGSLQAASKNQLSPLEREAYTESSIVDLPGDTDQSVESFGKHIKTTFGATWKEELCEGKISEGVIDVGSPALLIVCTSALRCLEFLRGVKEFTKECRAVKLFAKHLKLEEQVGLLKCRVNIACGTPNRIKKLIDVEALSLSRLKVVVLDMQRDAKCFSLFTLPQVSNEFWDLYRTHIEKEVIKGSTRLCFYGSVSNKEINKVLKKV